MHKGVVVVIRSVRRTELDMKRREEEWVAKRVSTKNGPQSSLYLKEIVLVPQSTTVLLETSFGCMSLP
jgi:hypothetical protein